MEIEVMKMTNLEIQKERKRMESMNYVSVHDLCRQCIVELKQNYMYMLSEEGTFKEVMNVDYDGPSMLDLVEADSIIPDATIFWHYRGISFVPDDFFCLMEG